MWTTQFEDGPFGIGFIQDGFAIGKTDEQAIETDAVELTRDAVAELVSDGDEIVGKRATLGPGDAQMVLDVSGGLGQVEGGMW